jgi:D-alanyl-D-alanine carboxypeptidase (penicillin-binding protein 5/6)
VKLEDQYFMSEHAWRKGGAPSGTSAMFVPVGTKATVDELLKGIIVQSGNDAAISIAENMSGNEGKFAQRMTEEARQLGSRNRRSGMRPGFFHPEHLMTARELAMLARHIIRTYPDYYQLFSLKEFAYRKHKFINRNPLLGLVAGVDGLKTGFIKEAGHGMVASAKQDRPAPDRGGQRPLHVGRAPGRGAPAAGVGLPQLLRGQAVRLRRGGGPRARVGRPAHVCAARRRRRCQHLAAAQSGRAKLKAHIVYQWPLKPPVKKGDQVALLRVTAGSEGMSEVPLYAAEDVEPGGTMRRGLDSILCLATRWLP